MTLRVAMIAPPWLSIPPRGYGGIEVVIDGLVQGLVDKGVSVDLFSLPSSRAPKGVTIHSLFTEEQYKDIHKPMYESLPILGAHLQFALDTIRRDGGFDIIHDHNGYYGPQLLSWVAGLHGLPPAVHTLHGPPFSNEETIGQGIPDNTVFWDQIASNPSKQSYIIGISQTLMHPAPKALLPYILDPVYNAIHTKLFPFAQEKGDYFITLARFSPEKGQHLAVQLCADGGHPLKMAGTVAGIGSSKQLLLELANPLSPYRNAVDFRYYSDHVLPLTVNENTIEYIGNVEGKQKMEFMAGAKALLFPIQWEEPFGLAVIEALACGTPVVAMNRGAMPEIITHGYNGFLANNADEFAQYMRRVHEIDPRNCRESVEQKFSARVMAEAYIDRYKEAIRRAKGA